ncbi:hypothetical protein HDU76_009232, partial [Blyttiomyces sp. JEL0837]
NSKNGNNSSSAQTVNPETSSGRRWVWYQIQLQWRAFLLTVFFLLSWMGLIIVYKLGFKILNDSKNNGWLDRWAACMFVNSPNGQTICLGIATPNVLNMAWVMPLLSFGMLMGVWNVIIFLTQPSLLREWYMLITKGHNSWRDPEEFAAGGNGSGSNGATSPGSQHTPNMEESGQGQGQGYNGRLNRPVEFRVLGNTARLNGFEREFPKNGGGMGGIGRARTASDSYLPLLPGSPDGNQSNASDSGRSGYNRFGNGNGNGSDVGVAGGVADYSLQRGSPQPSITSNGLTMEDMENIKKFQGRVQQQQPSTTTMLENGYYYHNNTTTNSQSGQVSHSHSHSPPPGKVLVRPRSSSIIVRPRSTSMIMTTPDGVASMFGGTDQDQVPPLPTSFPPVPPIPVVYSSAATTSMATNTFPRAYNQMGGYEQEIAIPKRSAPGETSVTFPRGGNGNAFGGAVGGGATTNGNGFMIAGERPGQGQGQRQEGQGQGGAAALNPRSPSELAEMFKIGAT